MLPLMPPDAFSPDASYARRAMSLAAIITAPLRAHMLDAVDAYAMLMP